MSLSLSLYLLSHCVPHHHPFLPFSSSFLLPLLPSHPLTYIYLSFPALNKPDTYLSCLQSKLLIYFLHLPTSSKSLAHSLAASVKLFTTFLPSFLTTSTYSFPIFLFFSQVQPHFFLLSPSPSSLLIFLL